MIEKFSIPFNREEYTTDELKQLINMFQDSNFMQCCLEELERRKNISEECYNIIKEGNCYFHTYDNDFYLSFITINKIENNEIIYSSIYINKPNSTVTYYSNICCYIEEFYEDIIKNSKCISSDIYNSTKIICDKFIEDKKDLGNDFVKSIENITEKF